MKTLLFLSLAFSAILLNGQTVAHPTLVPIEHLYYQYEVNSAQGHYRTGIAGYQYGDTVISATKDGKRFLIEVLKLEPKAYHEYRQSNVYYGIGLPLLIGGMATALFSVKTMIGDKQNPVPFTAGCIIGAGGLFMQYYGVYLSRKCIQTFNRGAVIVSTNSGHNFGFRFGFSMLPSAHRLLPAVQLQF